MHFFNSLTNEVAERYGLDGKTRQLLSELLSLIINENTGGVAGFTEGFRKAGLGDQAASWVSRGPNQRLTTGQFESVIGVNAINRLASRAGIPVSTASSALAFMVPKVIDALTPNGVVTPVLPMEIRSYVNRLTRNTATARLDASSILRTILPYAALALLAFIGYRYYNSIMRQTSQTEAATPAATPVVMTTNSNPSPSPNNDVELKTSSSSEELVKSLNFDTINFASGSAVIPRESLERLKKNADAIKNALKSTVFEIGGHTDNKGNAADNLKLSEQRAKAIRDYLISQGLSAKSLEVRGYGASSPVATNDTEEGRFRNRRIEFTAVK